MLQNLEGAQSAAVNRCCRPSARPAPHTHTTYSAQIARPSGEWHAFLCLVLCQHSVLRIVRKHYVDSASCWFVLQLHAVTAVQLVRYAACVLHVTCMPVL